jgi:hypothetical protein
MPLQVMKIKSKIFETKGFMLSSHRHLAIPISYIFTQLLFFPPFD